MYLFSVTYHVFPSQTCMKLFQNDMRKKIKIKIKTKTNKQTNKQWHIPSFPRGFFRQNSSMHHKCLPVCVSWRESLSFSLINGVVFFSSSPFSSILSICVLVTSNLTSCTWHHYLFNNLIHVKGQKFKLLF